MKIIDNFSINLTSFWIISHVSIFYVWIGLSCRWNIWPRPKSTAPTRFHAIRTEEPATHGWPSWTVHASSIQHISSVPRNLASINSHQVPPTATLAFSTPQRYSRSATNPSRRMGRRRSRSRSSTRRCLAGRRSPALPPPTGFPPQRRFLSPPSVKRLLSRLRPPVRPSTRNRCRSKTPPSPSGPSAPRPASSPEHRGMRGRCVPSSRSRACGQQRPGACEPGAGASCSTRVVGLQVRPRRTRVADLIYFRWLQIIFISARFDVDYLPKSMHVAGELRLDQYCLILGCIKLSSANRLMFWWHL
jgi:hypothetical protein